MSFHHPIDSVPPDPTGSPITVTAPRSIAGPTLAVSAGALFGSTFPLRITVLRSGSILCILEVTGRTSNTLNISGAIDGTSDVAQQIGDTVEMRMCAGYILELQTAELADAAAIAALTSIAVTTSGSYSDPAWLTHLAGSKITGNIAGNAGGLSANIAESQVTNLVSDLAGKQAAGSYLTANQTITLSGDVTGSGATAITGTLATVNSNVGSFTSANITVDAKGRITAAANGSGGGGGITIGTTAVTGGTAGRVLFEGAGPVVEDDAGLTYNGTQLAIPLGALSTPSLHFGMGYGIYRSGTNIIFVYGGLYKMFGMSGSGLSLPSDNYLTWTNSISPLAGPEGTPDVGLARKSAGVLGVSNGSSGDGALRVGNVGFNGTNPVAQGTITGSRGGNAALANLLTYLASRGDIIDSTT
jgi:hypothetical protein